MKAPVAMFLLWMLPVSAVCESLSYDQLPMYGHQSRTVQEQKADAQLIETVIKITGSRRAGADEALKEGWRFFNQGDLNAAIKRFNQAWLLAPRHPPVFHAFGWYMEGRGNIDEAIRMHEEALVLDPNYAMAMCGLARSYQSRAVTRTTAEEATALLAQALKLYEQASHATTVDSNLSYLYYQWAVLLALTKQYPEAWKKIHLSRQHGEEYITKEFVQYLSSRMPEPN